MIKEAEDLMLLGATIENIDVVYQIKPGTRIFILNQTNKEMVTGFEAASQGRKNIETNAWTNMKETPLIAQVRIRRYQGSPIPLNKKQYQKNYL